MRRCVVGHLLCILHLELREVCLAVSKHGRYYWLRVGGLGALSIYDYLAQCYASCFCGLYLNLGDFLRAVDNHIEDGCGLGHDAVGSTIVGILHRGLHLGCLGERNAQFLTLHVIGCGGSNLNTSPAFGYGNLMRRCVVGHLLCILYFELREVGCTISKHRSNNWYFCEASCKRNIRSYGICQRIIRRCSIWTDIPACKGVTIIRCSIQSKHCTISEGGSCRGITIRLYGNRTMLRSDIYRIERIK